MSTTEARLRETIAEQRAIIRKLRSIVNPVVELPAHWKLSSLETRLLMVLFAADGGLVSDDEILTALYEHPDRAPYAKMITVVVCRIRQKGKPFGIVIENRSRRGYSLTRETCALIRAVQAGDAEDAA